MRGFGRATMRNDAYSQFPRSPLETPETPTPFCVLSTKKNGLQRSDTGATSDSDGEPCVEPKLRSTDSVELTAFAAPN